MTRRDILTCVHEPFGDAFYFGPERLSERYEDDEAGRKESGFENSTYKTIFDRLDKESEEVRYFSQALLVLSFPIPFPSLLNVSHISHASSVHWPVTIAEVAVQYKRFYTMLHRCILLLCAI